MFLPAGGIIRMRMSWGRRGHARAAQAIGRSPWAIGAADFEGLAASPVTGEFSLPCDWPVGTYRLDIFLNGVLTKTVPMMVQ